MNTRLIVDEQSQLQEVPANGRPEWLRQAANFLSIVFHPVFVPVYLVYFMVYRHPYLFAGFTPFDKIRTMMMGVVMYALFPVVTVLLLKALKFVNSFRLDTQRDRIIPLVACGIWYFWIWYVWRNLPDYPADAIRLALAIWISASLALMANIVMKVSLHAIAMGILVSFLLLLSFSGGPGFGIYITAAVLIAGLVCTSRFLVSDHRNVEVYGGFFLGVISLLAAAYFW